MSRTRGRKATSLSPKHSALASYLAERNAQGIIYKVRTHAHQSKGMSMSKEPLLKTRLSHTIYLINRFMDENFAKQPTSDQPEALNLFIDFKSMTKDQRSEQFEAIQKRFISLGHR
ncbi:hypothetical protein ACFQ3S_17215 [Mucilaginibacter terrae]|uniref:hypothetical protein n=1 Tax=Mucilaginibacter terrae TaxID=1955052 RepID=UPI00363CABE8